MADYIQASLDGLLGAIVDSDTYPGDLVRDLVRAAIDLQNIKIKSQERAIDTYAPFVDVFNMLLCVDEICCCPERLLFSKDDYVAVDLKEKRIIVRIKNN